MTSLPRETADVGTRAHYIRREMMRTLAFFSGALAADATRLDTWAAPWIVYSGVSLALYIAAALVGGRR